MAEDEPTMAETKADDSKLTFADDLYDCFDKVHTRVTRGRHDMKMTKSFLDARYKIENEYGTKLKAALSNLPEFEEPGTFESSWKEMKNAAMSIANQHIQFASMCNEASSTLEKGILEVKVVKAKLNDRHQKLLKDRENKRNAHQKAREAYASAVKAAELAVTQRDAGRQQNVPDKQLAKLETVVRDRTKTVDTTNKAYQKAVAALKDAQVLMEKETYSMMQQFEDLEKRRLQLLHEQIKRFSQQHEFWKSSLEQTAVFLATTVAEIDPPKDLHDYIAGTKTGTPAEPHVVYEPISSAILERGAGIRTTPPTPTSEVKTSLPTAPPLTPSASSVPAPPPFGASVPAAPPMGAPSAPVDSGEKFARALYAFESEESDDLPFQAGDMIKLTACDEADEWWQGELNGRAGMFPANYVELVDSPHEVASPETPAAEPLAEEAAPAEAEAEAEDTLPEGATPAQGQCSALYDFDGQDSDELSFRAGEILTITGEMNGWYLGKRQGDDKVGIFPANYVELM